MALPKKNIEQEDFLPANFENEIELAIVNQNRTLIDDLNKLPTFHEKYKHFHVLAKVLKTKNFEKDLFYLVSIFAKERIKLIKNFFHNKLLDVDIIEYIYDADIVEENDFLFNTINWTCRSGDVRVLSKIWDKDVADKNLRILLNTACESGHWEIVKYLLQVNNIKLTDLEAEALLTKILPKDLYHLVKKSHWFDFPNHEQEIILCCCRNGRISLLEFLRSKSNFNLKFDDRFLTEAIDNESHQVVEFWKNFRTNT
jgi:hypothetical protein